MRALPSSTTVPIPVGVNTPPNPEPPARMRSTRVPCGTSSIAIVFAIICCWAFGLRPIWLAISDDTSPASTSLPMPLPGEQASLAMTLRPDLRWRTTSSITRSGVPTPMKPPIIRRAPSGISATASATDIAFIANSVNESRDLGKSRSCARCKSWRCRRSLGLICIKRAAATACSPVAPQFQSTSPPRLGGPGGGAVPLLQ